MLARYRYDHWLQEEGMDCSIQDDGSLGSLISRDAGVDGRVRA
jgi:hypothetical protein